MSYANIQAALFQHWNTLDFGLPTFYPDRNENPVGKHIRLSLGIAPTEIATLGSNGDNREQGFLQADVCYETGFGNGAILGKMEEIRAEFPTGLRISYSGQEVIIWTASMTPPRSEDGWLRGIITINFTAYVRR